MSKRSSRSKKPSMMSPARFWDLVKVSKYAKHKDHNKAAEILWKTYGEKDMEAAWARLLHYADALKGRIEKSERESFVRSLNLGEDDYNDLVTYIIGLGKDEYEQNMWYPELAVDRGGRGKYKESFEYAFHNPFEDPDDFIPSSQRKTSVKEKAPVKKRRGHKLYPKLSDVAIRKRINEEWASDARVRIDRQEKVHRLKDGAWVRAWVWVELPFMDSEMAFNKKWKK